MAFTACVGTLISLDLGFLMMHHLFYTGKYTSFTVQCDPTNVLETSIFMCHVAARSGKNSGAVHAIFVDRATFFLNGEGCQRH
jgi:hypothetical protein